MFFEQAVRGPGDDQRDEEPHEWSVLVGDIQRFRDAPSFRIPPPKHRREDRENEKRKKGVDIVGRAWAWPLKIAYCFPCPRRTKDDECGSNQPEQAAAVETRGKPIKTRPRPGMAASSAKTRTIVSRGLGGGFKGEVAGTSVAPLLDKRDEARGAAGAQEEICRRLRIERRVGLGRAAERTAHLGAN